MELGKTGINTTVPIKLDKLFIAKKYLLNEDCALHGICKIVAV